MDSKNPNDQPTDMRLIYVLTEPIKRTDERHMFHALDKANNHILVYVAKNNTKHLQSVKVKKFMLLIKAAYTPAFAEEPAKVFMSSSSKVSIQGFVIFKGTSGLCVRF